MQIIAALGGLDVLVNNASDLGPVAAGAPGRHRVRGLRARAGDERARPVPADQGAARLAGLVGARGIRRRGDQHLERRRRSTPIRGWGAYGASKAALHHLSRIWSEELAAEGITVLSFDPGDMDTPLHAAAVPDADRSALKRPEDAARELADAIGSGARRACGRSRVRRRRGR